MAAPHSQTWSSLGTTNLLNSLVSCMIHKEKYVLRYACVVCACACCVCWGEPVPESPALPKVGEPLSPSPVCVSSGLRDMSVPLHIHRDVCMRVCARAEPNDTAPFIHATQASQDHAKPPSSWISESPLGWMA